jgi:hypothetical protein
VNPALVPGGEGAAPAVIVRKVEEAEVDEMWSLVGSKQRPRWLWGALEFQLIDSAGTIHNTITLSAFDFGAGGSAVGSPTTSGGASGDLAGTVTLTDSSPFTEFIQSFTPSASEPLSFLLDTTENVEPTIPDSFSLGIFDSSGTGIATQLADIFLQVDLTAPVEINTYASDASEPPPGCPTCKPVRISAPRVQVVDTAEPQVLLLLAVSLGGVIIARRCGWV